MYVRLTYCEFVPSRIKDAKGVYMEEIVPVVSSQKGLIDLMLLEPTEPSNEYIAVTLWKTKADSDAYVFSGTFHRMVTKIESFLAKPPFVKAYYAEKLLVPTL
ncbi:antibiotic biosynthesis monooxygenase [Chitinophagaceae bacterium LB-8]|jgi:heme-degrading monooxygenase HmoA|uniref:Antibiotic biosynthesis monooxygenase n=1 Tax=Paraflavisolibacter caeni TaxID=2982496 RepID=A0A9X2XST8_9BACT|nr:antibiotic biosynthesis monooxygenase [Paraflavisolibacter caeni]MCU7547825.1 antibiotic biosynthesis monooxygenase [Paraflavisolibacter caeni]